MPSVESKRAAVGAKFSIHLMIALSMLVAVVVAVINSTYLQDFSNISNSV